MTLFANVELRYSTKRIAEITRPESPDYSTVNDTWLQTLCDDIVGCFVAESAGTYDDTNPAHVAVAVDGVIALAQLRITYTDRNERRWDGWLERLRNLSLVDHKDRISPAATRDEVRRFSDDQAYDIIPGRPGRMMNANDNTDDEP